MSNIEVHTLRDGAQFWLNHGHPMTCTGCRSEEPNQKSIPLLGTFCSQCREKLNQPVLYEGAISGDSIESLAVKMQQEFESRKRGLFARTRHVLEVKK